MRLRSFIVVLLLPLLALAQPPKQQIQSEAELVSALCDAQRDQRAKELLLKIYPELVTSRLWSALSDKAAAGYYTSQPQQSIAIYEVAIQVASQLHDPKLLAKTYYNLGRTYSGLNQHSKALHPYEKSREYFQQAGLQRDLIYILSDLGTVSFILGDYSKAKDYSEQTISLAERLRVSNAPSGAWPDAYGVAGALFTLGELAMREGNVSQAIERLQNSLALYQQLNSGNAYYNYFVTEAYTSLGRLYTSAGDHVRALSFLNKGLTIAKTLSQSEQVPDLLNSLGFLYLEQEDYDQATEYFQQSLQIYQAQQNRKESARLLLNLGVTQQRQSKYEQAIEFFQQSLQEAEAVDHKDVIIAAREGIGVLLTAKGDYQAALETLRSGLALTKQINDQMREAEILWRQAQTHYALRNYAQAETLSQQALHLARRLRLAKLSYLSATTLGQSYSAQNKSELAALTLGQAIEDVERMREMVAGTEGQVQNFFEYRLAPYHALIDLLIKQNKPLDALIYAERAKGRVLLDVLNYGKVDFAKAMTKQEKIEERRLNGNIVALNIQISQESSKTSNVTQLGKLNEQLESARLRYQAFQDSLYASHPELGARRVRTTALTLDEVSRLLIDDKTAILEYAVTNEKTYLFVLTRGQQAGIPELGVYQINSKDKELSKRAHELREMLADQSPIFADKARELYDVLIKPAADQLRNRKTLCIIPDSALWELPFQALQSKDDRYLLEDYVLYYAPSLGVLTQMQKQKIFDRGSASLLAFGNPRFGNDVVTNLKAAYRGESLAPLPEAETEVKALKTIWGSGRSRVLIGAEAGKKVFKAEAAKYKIIHLATHGILDDRNPMYSRLVMARSSSDPDDDGLLEAREIMQLNLHADLAVLSACQTARGRVGAGEGMIGMSWALFMAGVPTLVVSQWKVDSAATATLMISFHQRLAEQTRKDRTMKADALRQAALDLLKQPKYRHPFYWAGFVMIGRGE